MTVSCTLRVNNNIPDELLGRWRNLHASDAHQHYGFCTLFPFPLYSCAWTGRDARFCSRSCSTFAASAPIPTPVLQNNYATLLHVIYNMLLKLIVRDYFFGTRYARTGTTARGFGSTALGSTRYQPTRATRRRESRSVAPAALAAPAHCPPRS